MNFKGIFWLILIFSLIVSISFVSANDTDNTTKDIITSSTISDLTEINEENNLESLSENEVLFSQENSRIIYVGQNKTSDGGKGTLENPFESFELACNNLSGEDNVEINVYNGTYYLDSDLKFNTSNLFINGIGDVVIKNLRNEPGAYASFGLVSSSGNFTFSNLIFDGSNCIYLHANSNKHFLVFNGNSDIGIFNNCTFIHFDEALMFTNIRNKKFNYCNFLGTSTHSLCMGPSVGTEFNYCVISSNLYIGEGIYSVHSNMTFNNVWFGQNDLPGYITFIPLLDNGRYDRQNKITFPVNKHAILSSWENYVGNNTFEICGKWTWDDGTTDGIEKLYPLTVYFSSKTGILPQNTTMVNGTFKVIYESASEDNHIEVTLDNEDIFLDFKNNIQVTAEPIIYGDDQNITVSLPQSSQGIVYIYVNNQTYEYQVNGSSLFNFTVPDELLAGTYKVTVKLMDNISETHMYGQDTVEWKISQIDKELIIRTPADANVDDEDIIITILLENDETGNITVFAGDKNKTQECFGGFINIDILDLLVGGDNDITVYYSGDKKYSNQTKSDKITVNRINPKMNISIPSEPKVFEKINMNITLPVNVTGNITISVNDKNKTITELSDLIIVDISDLLIGGLNTVYIEYSGDNWWDSQTKRETINVAKLTPTMDIIINSTAKIDENFTIKINLPQNSTGKILIKINDKAYQINVSDSLSEVNISSSVSGVNNINITYLGDDNYYSFSKVINLTVLKWNISSNEIKISVSNHTNPVFIINLPISVSGNVSVKINNNEYIADLVGGSATLKIVDLTPGNYKADVTYLGDYKYNMISNNVLFSVPKPVLKANDINMLYTSGLKYSVYVTASGSPVIGKTVTFTINGKKINVATDTNGYANVKINLPPKSNKYTVTCEYQGVKIANKVKVNSIIKTKNLKVKKSANKLKIKVSLKKVNGKYLKGKKVTLKFKGKKYVAKTNKKGKVIFKIKKNIIKKLKTGKKYSYNVNYLKDKVTKRITVKK